MNARTRPLRRHRISIHIPIRLFYCIFQNLGPDLVEYLEAKPTYCIAFSKIPAHCLLPTLTGPLCTGLGLLSLYDSDTCPYPRRKGQTGLFWSLSHPPQLSLPLQSILSQSERCILPYVQKRTIYQNTVQWLQDDSPALGLIRPK